MMVGWHTEVVTDGRCCFDRLSDHFPETGLVLCLTHGVLRYFYAFTRLMDFITFNLTRINWVKGDA